MFVSTPHRISKWVSVGVCDSIVSHVPPMICPLGSLLSRTLPTRSLFRPSRPQREVRPVGGAEGPDSSEAGPTGPKALSRLGTLWSESSPDVRGRPPECPHRVACTSSPGRRGGQDPSSRRWEGTCSPCYTPFARLFPAGTHGVYTGPRRHGWSSALSASVTGPDRGRNSE